MKLGALSISLAVKDLQASQAFYEALGFEYFAGNAEENWLILKNEDDQVVGLFQGMFDRNMLTFNPGWDNCANNLESFTDIRELYRSLKKAGIEPEGQIDENSRGPASFMLFDPDNNPILIDQHR